MNDGYFPCANARVLFDLLRGHANADGVVPFETLLALSAWCGGQYGPRDVRELESVGMVQRRGDGGLVVEFM